ncbi:hypothetical protein CLV55_106122 [Flavobacterium aciduliphilum]|uniref:Uncharacterized protein n=1 Tax=Flavobacterium aciduliphilum TaxID=1101402 RepID=A0A328YCL4_9FLAO|nr:hypothetical protein CLV55_106122 [Flavobacterium aciduliphilum]
MINILLKEKDVFNYGSKIENIKQNDVWSYVYFLVTLIKKHAEN